MKAAVLGIGTELTDGQIVNKNASWISAKLKELGLITNVHLVVPDEKSLMQEGLEFCANKAEILFLTGGLGPTSDDFTRDIVTEWAGTPLVFDESSWIHVNQRLTSRGYTVKEIQKQQCYFPAGSQILFNSEGTANGFALTAKGKKIFVLPGPPREIDAIWRDHVSIWLNENTQHLDPYITRKWDTMGVGESDIAVIVEEILKNSNVDKGYRVHLPYVEVKISHFKSEEKKFESLIESLTKALEFCTVSRDGEDVARILQRKLEPIESLKIQDQVTGQFLMNRLMPFLRDFFSAKQWTFSNREVSLNDTQLDLWIKPLDEQSCEIGMSQKGQIRLENVTSPYKNANMKERRLQYFSEKAIIFWSKQIG